MNAASMEISMGELKKLEINYHMIQLYTSCGYTPEGLKSEYGRDIFSSIYCGTVHNCQHFKSAYTSIDRWIDKKVLLGCIKEWN